MVIPLNTLHPEPAEEELLTLRKMLIIHMQDLKIYKKKELGSVFIKVMNTSGKYAITGSL